MSKKHPEAGFYVQEGHVDTLQGIEPVILINSDFQKKVHAFCVELNAFQERVEALPEADAALFKPLLEYFFRLLSCLIGDFTDAEWHGDGETTGTDHR